jgi:hypothetical protein
MIEYLLFVATCSLSLTLTFFDVESLLILIDCCSFDFVEIRDRISFESSYIFRSLLNKNFKIKSSKNK